MHADGASRRPVQWYFDNLLPEEQLREAIGREAGLRGDDAFALLEHLGAESAGSLVLLPPGHEEPAGGGLRPLDDDALCRRIRDLPRTTLASGAAKRMSAAGAQHKLLVVLKDDRLYVQRCRNRARTRLGLFGWLVFNVVVGNNDNHLKNLSFTVDADGIALALAYDLLCTAVYETRAYTQQRARWPGVEMAIALPGASYFGDVPRAALLAAGARRVDRRDG